MALPYLFCNMNLFDLHQRIIYGNETSQKCVGITTLEDLSKDMLYLVQEQYPEVNVIYLKGFQAEKYAEKLNNYFNTKFKENTIKVEVIE